MDEPPAYHVIFCTYGFWLPNDPRGSQSTVVRAPHLRHFGPATGTGESRSVAHVAHDFGLRRLAKEALKYPEVIFDGHQALSVADGFAEMTTRSGFVIHACSILPCHVHMVIRHHRYSIKQVVRLLRQKATAHLLADARHPFAHLREVEGHLPSVWAQDCWPVFKFTDEEIAAAIAYVEQNPIKEGKRPPRWSFVTPFIGLNASTKRR